MHERGAEECTLECTYDSSILAANQARVGSPKEEGRRGEGEESQGQAGKRGDLGWPPSRIALPHPLPTLHTPTHI